MKRLAMTIVAAAGLAAPVLTAPMLASAQTTSRSDVAYCNALADTYVYYIARDETSARHIIRQNQGNAAGYVAVAQCRQGITASAIPTLEQELRNAKFTLPARG